MMSIFKELKTHPTQRDRLEFGLIVLAGMAIIGGLNVFGYVGKPANAAIYWTVGVVVCLLATIPPIGRLLYIVWMAFGLIIGFFTAPVIMLIVYAIAIVPISIVFKLMRRDTMRRQLDRNAVSYWEDYPSSDDPASYVRQF